MACTTASCELCRHVGLSKLYVVSYIFQKSYVYVYVISTYKALLSQVLLGALSAEQGRPVLLWLTTHSWVRLSLKLW